MKQLASLLIFILLIGCSNIAAAPEPDNTASNLETFTTVVSTAAPTTAVPSPVVEEPVESYPAPTVLPTQDGYPAPPTPILDTAAYPVETPEPTEMPIVESAGSGLHYIDDVGVWRVTADGLTAQIIPLAGASTPILSPDGTKLAYMLAGEPAIILLDIRSGEITSLSTGTESFVCCVFDWSGDLILAGVQGPDEFGPNIGRLVAFSPDNTIIGISENLISGSPSFHPTGLRVAYSDNGGIQIYDLGAGSTPIAVTAITDASDAPSDAQNLTFSSASWSPSQQYIAWAASFVESGEFKLGLAILDLEDDSVQIFHPYTALGREYLAPRPTWHPSQPLIAFETIDEDASQAGVWLINYATGEERFVMPGRNPLFSPDGAHLAFEHEAGIQIYTLEDGSFTLLPAGRIVDWR